MEVGGQEWQHSLLHLLGLSRKMIKEWLDFKRKTPVKDIEGDSFGSFEGQVLTKQGVSLSVIISMRERATKHKLTIVIYIYIYIYEHTK